MIILLVCNVFVKANEDPLHISLNLGSDPFFGYFCNTLVSYKLNDIHNAGIYSNYLAIPRKRFSFSPLFYAFEIGYQHDFQLSKNVSLSAQLGMLEISDNQIKPNRLVDFWEASLLPTYQNNSMLFTGGLIYYKVHQNSIVKADQLWFFSNCFYKHNQKIYYGLLYEYYFEFNQIPLNIIYHWIGPVLQYNVRNKYPFRFSVGYDIINLFYYKTGITFTF